jgi:predicted RecA/RadA family phage recombinase
MKAFLQDGVDINFTAPVGGVVGGNAYLIGAAQFGFAVADTVAGDIAVARRLGVYTGVPKAAGAAWAQGDILYWDNTAFNFTKTAANNTRVGSAANAALLADTVGDVLLDGNVG